MLHSSRVIVLYIMVLSNTFNALLLYGFRSLGLDKRYLGYSKSFHDLHIMFSVHFIVALPFSCTTMQATTCAVQ